MINNDPTMNDSPLLIMINILGKLKYFTNLK
jgi:hypothetical protein